MLGATGRRKTGRTGRRTFVASALGIALACLSSRTSLGEDWKITGDISYSEGDYGSDIDTEILYIPITLKRYFEHGALSASVPFVSVDSSGTIPVAGGTIPVDDSASGVGDIVGKGWFYAMPQQQNFPGLDLVAQVKLPTADEDKGLGSGEPDFGAGVESYYWFNRTYIGFLDLGYNVIGEPAGADYNNQVEWDIGLGRYTYPWWHTLFLYYRTPVIDDEDATVELSYSPSYRLRRNTELHATFDVGLSDGAPDYVLTGGVSQWF